MAILVAFFFYLVEMFIMAFTTEYTALTSYSIMQVRSLSLFKEIEFQRFLTIFMYSRILHSLPQ